MPMPTLQPGAQRQPAAPATDSWAEVRSELVQFVGRRVETPEVAEDIVQDVLERMQRSGAAGIENPQAWLYRAARNAVIDHYRTRRPMEQLPAELGAEHSELDPELDARPNDATQELARCLRPLIDELPASYRRALTLVDLEGNSHEAAAKVEHVSVSGMKSRVQRGRVQLGERLQECCVVQTTPRGAVTSYARRDPERDCGC